MSWLASRFAPWVSTVLPAVSAPPAAAEPVPIPRPSSAADQDWEWEYVLSESPESHDGACGPVAVPESSIAALSPAAAAGSLGGVHHRGDDDDTDSDDDGDDTDSELGDASFHHHPATATGAADFEEPTFASTVDLYLSATETDLVAAVTTTTTTAAPPSAPAVFANLDSTSLATTRLLLEEFVALAADVAAASPTNTLASRWPWELVMEPALLSATTSARSRSKSRTTTSSSSGAITKRRSAADRSTAAGLAARGCIGRFHRQPRGGQAA
ncbi:hypothetical protein H9P43_001774 [Blastocladiella emersonii ATCC 22665]|nr:hypothetical protein H9P43_001774 [Blastocladiella emersonii ATCC 22665]